MSSFSLEAFDSHIENLRTQLQFLNGILSDHNAPDWVATDLVSLRNKSGRLQDDMQKFRDQLDNEGLGQKVRFPVHHARGCTCLRTSAKHSRLPTNVLV